MYSTYHFNSAQDINIDVLESIKTLFKSNPITITIEQDEDIFELSSEQKQILDERLNEDETTYLTENESFNLINKKYGL